MQCSISKLGSAIFTKKTPKNHLAESICPESVFQEYIPQLEKTSNNESLKFICSFFLEFSGKRGGKSIFFSHFLKIWQLDYRKTQGQTNWAQDLKE